jgi:hypothetical protein
MSRSCGDEAQCCQVFPTVVALSLCHRPDSTPLLCSQYSEAAEGLRRWTTLPKVALFHSRQDTDGSHRPCSGDAAEHGQALCRCSEGSLRRQGLLNPPWYHRVLKL